MVMENRRSLPPALQALVGNFLRPVGHVGLLMLQGVLVNAYVDNEIRHSGPPFCVALLSISAECSLSTAFSKEWRSHTRRCQIGSFFVFGLNKRLQRYAV